MAVVRAGAACFWRANRRHCGPYSNVEASRLAGSCAWSPACLNRGQLSPGSAPHDPVQESKCCDSLRRPKVSSSSGVRGEGGLVFGQQDEVEIKFNLVSEVPSKSQRRL